MDSAFVLKSDQFPEVVGSLFPGNAIGDKKEHCVVPFLFDNAGDVSENVSLFAACGTVGFTSIKIVGSVDDGIAKSAFSISGLLRP